MSAELGPRKLATIMAVDLAGYSALAETDELAAIAAVEEVRAHLAAAAKREGGRIFNTAGDGFMLEFGSVTGALSAAEQVCAANDCRKVRIGVHLGDVMVTSTGDMLGHGVNVAARLQQMAKPGVVLVSVDIRRAVRGAMADRLHAYGALKLSKMAETMETFSLGAVALSPRATAPALPAPQGAPVLAVLPFDNENTGDELDFFADGVADEIMLILMRQSALKVIGRTSSFQFRGKDKSVAAAALRATHVLDGAVRRTKTKVRVNTQLIDATTGVALWSQRYDSKLVDAFDVQDEIASEVANALAHALSRHKRHSAIDPAAYDLYLRARRNWLTLSDIDEEHVETLLEKCVERAPDFAPAWADLASVRAFLLPRSHDVIGEPAHQAGLAAAERALALDPDHPHALVALALLKPAFGDYEEKLALTARALARAPNDPELHVAHATFLYGVGRVRDALEALRVAAELDPRGPAVESLFASLLATTGDEDGAIEAVRAAWSRWPDSAFAWYMMWVLLGAAGRVQEAMALADTAPKHGVAESDIQVLRNYLALMGMDAEARRPACVAALSMFAQQSEPLSIAACMLAAANGCADEAHDLLEAALDAGRALRPDPHDGFGMARAQSSLQFFVHTADALRNHPRFPKLAARLGLVKYWHESGRWPDCADEVSYDFRAACLAAL